MRINHNIAALNAYRNMSINQENTSKSLEKLSSGLRINRAADDAAGLAISEKMRSQIRGLDMAERNAMDGISVVQTADGALNSTQEILQRMRELAVQSANDSNTETDRQNIQQEINQLTSEVNRIGNTTEFNTAKLLDGSRNNTLVPNGVSFDGGNSSYVDAATGLNLNIDGAGTGLSAGNHTLTVTKVPGGEKFADGSTSYEINTVASEITNSGSGNVSFANNSITYDLSNLNQKPTPAPGDTVTLTAIDNNTFSVTDSSGNFTDTYTVGTQYDSHGISFKMDSASGFIPNDTLQFKVGDATTPVKTSGSISTVQEGFDTKNAGHNSIVYTKPITVDTSVETGDWTITKEPLNGWTVEFTAAGATSPTYTEKLTNDSDPYNNHGLSFQVSSVDMNAGDKITFSTTKPTQAYDYNITLDNGETKTVANNIPDGEDPIVLANGSFDGLTFNSLALKEGSFSFNVDQATTLQDNALHMQIGANAGQTVALQIDDMRSKALMLSTDQVTGDGSKTVTLSDNKTNQKVWYTTVAGADNGTSGTQPEYALDVTSSEKAQAAMTVLDDAVNRVSSERARLGAIQNRLEYTVDNLKTMNENVTSSESRIRDVDMAEEMTNFTKNNILNQAAQAMLSQANQLPQGVLQLLK